EIGEKIFEYIFPGVSTSDTTSDMTGVSPFLVHTIKPVPGGHEGDDESSGDSNDILVESPTDERSLGDARHHGSLNIPDRPATSYSVSRSSTLLGTGYEKSIRSFMPSRTPSTSYPTEMKSRRSN